MTNPHRLPVRLAGLLVLIALLLGAEPAVAPPRFDSLGDPLPAGVTARLGTARLFQQGIYQAVFSPDGKMLAGHDASGQVCLWEVKTGRELHRMPAVHSHSFAPSVPRLVFAPDGKRLAFACQDGTLRLFDPSTGREAVQASTKPGVYTGLAFAPDSKSLALAGKGPLQVWDVENQPAGKVLGEPLSASSLAYSADGKTLLIVSTNLAQPRKPTLSLWNLALGKEQSRHTLETETTFAILAPGGRTLAAPTRDGKHILLLDPATGKELRRARCPGADSDAGFPQSLHFSADGKGLASVSRDGCVLVWNVATGKLRHQVKGLGRNVRLLALSPDSNLIVYTCRSDQALHLLDVSRGKDVHSFAGHRRGPLSVAFAADGKTVVTVSRDGGHSLPPSPGGPWSVRVWDSTSGQEAEHGASAARGRGPRDCLLGRCPSVGRGPQRRQDPALGCRQRTAAPAVARASSGKAQWPRSDLEQPAAIQRFSFYPGWQDLADAGETKDPSLGHRNGPAPRSVPSHRPIAQPSLPVPSRRADLGGGGL